MPVSHSANTHTGHLSHLFHWNKRRAGLSVAIGRTAFMIHTRILSFFRDCVRKWPVDPRALGEAAEFMPLLLPLLLAAAGNTFFFGRYETSLRKVRRNRCLFFLLSIRANRSSLFCSSPHPYHSGFRHNTATAMHCSSLPISRCEERLPVPHHAWGVAKMHSIRRLRHRLQTGQHSIFEFAAEKRPREKRILNP